jgi:hypothetical protein
LTKRLLFAKIITGNKTKEKTMGRYVSGDFDYKFAFGEQGSNFVEVLENIVDDANANNAEQVGSVIRYIADVGEKVELIIEDKEALVKQIEEYIESFEEMTDDDKKLWAKGHLEKADGYWDKYMMVQFLDHIKENNTSFSMNFHVEY